MPGRSRSASQVARVLIARPLSIDTLLDFLRVSSLSYIFGLFSVSYSPLLFFFPGEKLADEFQVPSSVTRNFPYMHTQSSKGPLILSHRIFSLPLSFLFFFSFFSSVYKRPTSLSLLLLQTQTHKSPQPSFSFAMILCYIAAPVLIGNANSCWSFIFSLPFHRDISVSVPL